VFERVQIESLLMLDVGRGQFLYLVNLLPLLKCANELKFERHLWLKYVDSVTHSALLVDICHSRFLLPRIELCFLSPYARCLQFCWW